MANAATIDSMDGHDGHRLVKGHAGAALLPSALAFIDGMQGQGTHDLVVAVAIGYEVALRAGIALHRTAADYHSSGAWNALGAAAIGARLLCLERGATWHALGIAEYSAPRAPMMRAIDHPTMVKDSSAWGAQAGVAAALLAAEGFTGAPAELMTSDDVDDLGSRWHTLEQYFKPYPVCRWAHPAVQAALSLVSQTTVLPEHIDHVDVTTFAAATRLTTREPSTTEQAQYSLPFPVAAALVHGELTPDRLLDLGSDPDVRRLSNGLRLIESGDMTRKFPAVRQAAVRIHLRDGRLLSSDVTVADGDPETPMSDDQLSSKFALYTQRLDPRRAGRIAGSLLGTEDRGVDELLGLLTDPPAVRSVRPLS